MSEPGHALAAPSRRTRRCRRPRDCAIRSSRDARRKLKPRGRPYYRAVERGLHIGYRRAGRGIAGAWSTRLYLGHGKYEEHQLGLADDTPGTGLDYWQAIATARERILLKKHKQAVGLIASLNESMALADKKRWASLREGLDQHYFAKRMRGIRRISSLSEEAQVT